MLGISPSAWEDACRAMGPEEAAVVLLAMLERFNEIRSPGGYLRALTAKAGQGAFSCGPMVMALTRNQAA
jgi:replication initiation protein RepC